MIVYYTRTLRFEDGTETSQVFSFDSQSPNTIIPLEFGITGNTAACVLNYILFEDGDIITAENGDLLQYEH